MTPAITVITPTYNRAHTLGRLRESLLAQTFGDFEWVIVDDGSEDETEALSRVWMDKDELDIRYRRQPNRGKHVAVNRGIEMARGELLTVVDSDDWLTEDGLERLLHHWNRLPDAERGRFSGVVGLCAFEDGRIIGEPFPRDPLDCDFVEATYVHGVTGDKHGLHRTDVAREYPFPFEELRGYVTEALVSNRIALKYRARHVNEVVLLKEYQAGGLSDLALELLIKTAPATRQFHLETAALPHRLPLSVRLRSYANYVRFSRHVGIGLREQAAEVPSRALLLALYPVGLALHLRDRLRHPQVRPANTDRP